MFLRPSHNPKVVGSNPTPETNSVRVEHLVQFGFFYCKNDTPCPDFNFRMIQFTQKIEHPFSLKYNKEKII